MHPDEYYEQNIPQQQPPQPPPVPMPQQNYQTQYPYPDRRLAPPEPDYIQQGEMDAVSPLSIIDEIQTQPSEKGTHEVKIGGRPIDLHILEDYVVKISPYSLKTILRYHNARTIEEMKGYSKGVGLKMKGGTIILIMLALGLAVIGIMMLTMFPEIMQGLAGGVP